jgi:hypothetical protein
MGLASLLALLGYRMVLKVLDNSGNDAERTMLMLWRMKRGAGMMAATYSNADFNFGSPSAGDPKRDRRRAIVGLSS